MDPNEHIHLLPYPKDWVTRYAFLVADLISGIVIVGITVITLKTTMHF
jgi:hypothetical protein